MFFSYFDNSTKIKTKVLQKERSITLFGRSLFQMDPAVLPPCLLSTWTSKSFEADKLACSFDISSQLFEDAAHV